MKYRKLGKLDWQVSALGFGAMRLPVLNEDYAKIDEAQAIPMIRYAVDHGVNYIDSAWGYHRGMSEVIVEKALRYGYREKVKVATKLPCPDVQTAADFDRLLNEQLGRLNSKIDFYLLHGLNKMQWAKVRDLGVMKWAEHQQAEGRIGHLGFSFHDNFDVFKEIIDAYDNWTLAQIQYNFMDEQNQAGTKGLEYAHKKGLAVVVMEPIRGGRLARPPEKVVKLWAERADTTDAGGMGVTLGMESSGSEHRAQRHGQHAAGGGECGQRGTFPAEQPDRRRSGAGGTRQRCLFFRRCCLHRLPVLHAVSERGGHSPCFQPL